MDLIVWLGDDGSILGFQLAYDKLHSEHALTWKRRSGFRHESVDDGEGRPGKYKATPILIADGVFAAPKVAQCFKDRAAGLDQRVADFVYAKLIDYPG